MIKRIAYTPSPAPVSVAKEYAEDHGFSHLVLVLPSSYGTDNTSLLSALAELSPSAVGVAVLDPFSTPPPSPETLQSLHDAGVRGIRIHTDSQPSPATLQAHAELCRPHNWALQLCIPLASFARLHTFLPTLGVRVVADHFAGAVAGENPYAQRGFAEVVDLMKRGELWVKISAPYLGSAVGAGEAYGDMSVVARELLSEAPGMCVYGSNFPHTHPDSALGGNPLALTENTHVDDRAVVSIVKGWAGSWRTFEGIMVSNPRRLWAWEGDD